MKSKIAILTSEKKDFLAGADIDKVFLITDPEEVMQLENDFKAAPRPYIACCIGLKNSLTRFISPSRKAPEQTAETMTDDGFVKTGDVGVMDADGCLKLTGRLKDIFKTAKGKYIAPVPIELKLTPQKNPQ